MNDFDKHFSEKKVKGTINAINSLLSDNDCSLEQSAFILNCVSSELIKQLIKADTVRYKNVLYTFATKILVDIQELDPDFDNRFKYVRNVMKKYKQQQQKEQKNMKKSLE